MGANTLRTDDPEMRGTNGHLPLDRIRGIITQSGLIPVTGKKIFNHGPKPIVFTSDYNSQALQDQLAGKAEVVTLPEGPHGLSLQAALTYLAGRGVETVLIEGGAQLNYAALAEGIVDEILLTVMPSVSGQLGAPTFADGPEHLGKPFLELELLTCEKAASGEIFLHYRLQHMK